MSTPVTPITPEPTPEPTPTPTPTPVPPTPVVPPITPEQSAIAQVQADIASDTTAVKGALVNVAAQARTEYEALSAGAKAKLHQLLNDIESAGQTSLAGIHTLFGEKAPTK